MRIFIALRGRDKLWRLGGWFGDMRGVRLNYIADLSAKVEYHLDGNRGCEENG